MSSTTIGTAHFVEYSSGTSVYQMIYMSDGILLHRSLPSIRVDRPWAVAVSNGEKVYNHTTQLVHRLRLKRGRTADVDYNTEDRETLLDGGVPEALTSRAVQ